MLEKLAIYELLKEAIKAERVVRAMASRLNAMRRAGVLSPIDHREFWKGFVQNIGVPKSRVRSFLRREIRPGTAQHKALRTLLKMIF